MSDFFPANLTSALAMLYVKNQDLKDKTPTEIYEIYKAAEKEIFDISTSKVRVR